MIQADWFEDWFDSPYYQVLYQHRDKNEAADFLENLLNYLQPKPGARMLDVACGEGRFAIQLAAKGYDVTGIDLSNRSIAIAKAHENEHLHFFVHDMRLPFHINYFDYAFNFFTSFGYFKYFRENIAAAKSIAKSLHEDGVLVIDYLNANHALKQLIPSETVVRGSYTFEIERRLEDGRFVKDIRFIDSDGKQRHYAEQVAAFTMSDFQRIFESAGMTIVQSFGDYNLSDFNPETSPRMILILKKQNA